MKTKILPSLFCLICGVLIVLLANVCQSAEPPNDFLQNNYGVIQDDNVSDTGFSFTNILTMFTNANTKTWVSDQNDQWILKMTKKDLATDSTDEMAWVFQRRKADPKPLIVLVRVVANKEEATSQSVAEMANNLAAQFADANPQKPVTQPALKAIEPFGGLKWADGIVQTIKKINQMDGIEKLSVGTSRKPGASLKGLVNDSEIVSALAGLVHYDIFKKGSYKDKDGVEHPLALGIENFTAEPIYLKGSPFRMTLNFVSSPGFAIAYPEAVFPVVVKKVDSKAPGFPETEIKASCSFALKNFDLSSTAPMQSDKIQEIIKSLKDKYKDYNAATDYGQGQAVGGLVLQDTSGSTLRADWQPSTEGNGSTLSITYSRSKDQWDQLYQSHLSDLEKKAASKKPDKSNDF